MRRGGLTTARAVVYIGLGSLTVFIITSIFTSKTHQDPPNVANIQQADTANSKELSEMKLRLDALQTSLNLAVARIEELSCVLGIKNETHGGFCLTKDTLELGGYISWDWKLAFELENLLAEQSVVEFGAGLGWYGRFFLRVPHAILTDNNETETRHFFSHKEVMKMIELPQLVYSWKGYDEATFVERFTGGLVKFLHLSQPIWLTEKFDWVLSFETGERIPARYEDNFIDNLVRHACKGIVLSWGMPGQNFYYHINGRSNEYITEKMARRGFLPDFDWEDQLRAVTELSWLKYSLMVFRPEQKLQDEACQVPKNQSRIPWEEVFKKMELEEEKNPGVDLRGENSSVFLNY